MCSHSTACAARPWIGLLQSFMYRGRKGSRCASAASGRTGRAERWAKARLEGDGHALGGAGRSTIASPMIISRCFPDRAFDALFEQSKKFSAMHLPRQAKRNLPILRQGRSNRDNPHACRIYRAAELLARQGARKLIAFGAFAWHRRAARGGDRARFLVREHC